MSGRISAFVESLTKEQSKEAIMLLFQFLPNEDVLDLVRIWANEHEIELDVEFAE